MEGTASKLLSRLIGARTAAALLTVGVLSVGLSACGSDSSSDSASAAEGSASSVVNKEAGIYRYVQLTVKNDTSPENDPDSGPWFYVCFTQPDKCGDGHGIKPDPARGGDGETATAPSTVLPLDDVTGELAYPPGYSYWVFTAHNPAAARPTITLQRYTTIQSGCTPLPAPCSVGDAQKWALDEPSAGQDNAQDVKIGGNSFVLTRSPDTSDDIVMTLTARGEV
jgi:hypothetical protein